MLQEKIKQDLKKAILNRDLGKKEILRVLLGELDRYGKVIDDNVTLTVIKKMHQNAKDMNENTEAVILNEYLPKMLNNDELYILIEDLIDKGINNIGAIMKELKSNYNGMYDGKRASEIIKELL